MYNNLKLQNSHENGGQLQSHINVHHQSAYPDSTSHLIHSTPPSTLAAVPTAQATNSNDTSISDASYHPNYSFRCAETASVSSSGENDYVINSNVVTSNQNNGTTVLASSTTGLHQRRGSLQLWQFLVALLDEPAARYIF